MTLFQQRWRSKRLIRGYHGDHIGQTKFERWYLPEALPSIHSVAPSTGIAKWVDGRSKSGGRSEDEKRREKAEKEGRAPIGTMMFREVERRIDVLVFRACFASSVWAARQLVVHGKVLINGAKVSLCFSRSS
jgi:ribosomal protein S4